MNIQCIKLLQRIRPIKRRRYFLITKQQCGSVSLPILNNSAIASPLHLQVSGWLLCNASMTILERTKELNGMRKHIGWRILIPTEGRAILLLTILNILSSTLPQCMTIILRYQVPYRYLYATILVLRCSVRYTGMYRVNRCWQITGTRVPGTSSIYMWIFLIISAVNISSTVNIPIAVPGTVPAYHSVLLRRCYHYKGLILSYCTCFWNTNTCNMYWYLEEHR